MRILFASVWILFFLLTGCSKEPTKTEDTPSPQEHIPWPSLADSPWTMFHHDPQSTGRSQYVGPQIGNVKWEFSFHPGHAQGSVAIGLDSSIYFASSRDSIRAAARRKIGLPQNVTLSAHRGLRPGPRSGVHGQPFGFFLQSSKQE